MFFSERPNKFIIETAVVMGIDNAKTSRNLNQEAIKAEYEKAKKALAKWGESEEITLLYTKFITMYEANLTTSTQAKTVLKDELKWKHLGDLREAVKNWGIGLSLADIEGLNQFALAEYWRQERSDNPQIDEVLKGWFRIYETLKSQAISGWPAAPRVQAEKLSETLSLDEAIKKGFGNLFSGKKVDPITVLHEDKKYRFAVEVHETWFTLWGRKFEFAYPSDIRRGSFEFKDDKIIFSGIPRGENRNKVLFEVTREEALKKLTWRPNEIVFKFEDFGNIVARWTGEYLPSSALINSPSPPANAPRSTSPVEREWVKYGLKELEWYAKQELAKFGKDISALQIALKAKKFYTGEITGTFDMATLDAVLAFQKTIKDAKYGADGLVGKETISALFWIPGQPGNPSPTPPLTPAPGVPPVAPLPAPMPGPGPWSGGTPGAPPAAPRPGTTSVPGSATILELSGAMYSFRQVIKANDEKVNGKWWLDSYKKILPTTESTVRESKQVIDAAFTSVDTFIKAIDPKKLSVTDLALYNAYVLEVARYFADQHTVYTDIGSANRHWKKYDTALAYSAKLVGSDLERNGIKIEPVPSDSDIRKKIRSIDTATADKLEALFAKWYTWDDIMSNPKLRGAWDEIREKVLWKYEDTLQSQLKSAKAKYDAGTMTFAWDEDGTRKKAFELMIDIMGAGAWYDVKDKNYDRYRSAALIAGAAIAWVGVTIGTWGIGGLALWALTTTGGMLLAKWEIRDGVEWAKDAGMELLFNLATFGGGGLLAKWWALAFARTGSTVARAGIAITEWSGGALLWAWVEKWRAYHEWIGLSWPESLWNNFLWALLPLSLHYKWVFKAEATKLGARMKNNLARSEVTPGSPAVRAEAQAIAQEAEALGPKIQAEQAALAPQGAPPKAPNAVPAPAPAQAPKAAPAGKPAPKHAETPGSYDVGNGYILEARPDNTFSVLKDGVSQFGRPKTLAEVEQFLSVSHNTHIPETVKAQIAARPSPTTVASGEPGVAAAPAQTARPVAHEPAPQAMKWAEWVRPTAPIIDDSQFSSWFEKLVPKLHKKDFPAGSTIKAEWLEITAKEWWKYTVNYGGKTYNYDSHAEMSSKIGTIIKNPEDRLNILKSSESNRMKTHMKSFDEVAIPGSNGNLRWKHEGDGKMWFQKKDPETGSWNSVEASALSVDDQIAAAAQWYKVSPSQIKEGIKKSEGATTHEVIESAGLLSWFKKQPKIVQHKIEEWIKKAIDGTINGGNATFWAPFTILGWITNWGHGASWGKSLATGAIIEGTSMLIHPFDTEQWKDKNGNINWWNAGEFIAYTLIAANCGILRAGIASLGWWYYNLYKESSPGAEVPTTK